MRPGTQVAEEIVDMPMGRSSAQILRKHFWEGLMWFGLATGK